ncbi:MAG: hypothetical protein O3A00_14220 [Planctomycetota bacterium]|nr:hypothetical protein [Planctomycetota bacterium]
MTRRSVSILAITVLLAAGFLASGGLNAQKKGKTRPLTSSQVMAGLVKPEFLKLKAGLEKSPQDDDAWKALATSAALLNESSYILMADERCPDKPWEEGSMILRKASLNLLTQIEKKDAAGALEAFAMVQQSCKTCHAEHKYKKK